MVIDSPLSAQKYLRRISKDFSTVRRFSNTPNPLNIQSTAAPAHIGVSTLSVPTPRDALDVELPTTPRGIRKRQRLRKRSSVSSTLSKVLILNVRDLLRAQANSEDAAREEVPRHGNGSGIRMRGGVDDGIQTVAHSGFELGFSSSCAHT